MGDFEALGGSRDAAADLPENFHCVRSSERAHITENNGFYLVSLLTKRPKSLQKLLTHTKIIVF